MRGQQWSDADDKVIRELWATHHVSRVAHKLKRTNASVTRRAYRLLGADRIREIRYLQKRLRCK